MKKLLKPKELLLLTLANLLDIYEEAKDPFGLSASSYKQLYGWVPRRFKRHNFAQLAKREFRTGNIEKVEKGGEIFLRITPEGKEVVKRDFPLFAMRKKKWDGKWRIVVFDIAETSKIRRDALRLKLKELGFGMLQKSVWITPHDIMLDFREFIDSKGLGDFVYLMEVSHLLAGDPKILAEKIWKLSELNIRYREVIAEIGILKRACIGSRDRALQSKYVSTGMVVRGKKKLQDRFCELKRKYLEIMLSDPCLPSELLPSDWLQEKALQFIKSIEL